MEEKLRRKKIRKVAVIVVVLAAVAAIILSTTIEKADYREALGKEIDEAKTLMSEAEAGYSKGQYLPGNLVTFQNEISEAEEVYEDKDSVYDEQKAAYEKLKAAEDTFKDAANSKDIKKKNSKEVKKKKTAETQKATEKKSNSKEKSKEKIKSKDDSINVTIEIRCDNIIGHEKDESVISCVPSDGVVLAKEKYNCKSDATVYDVLLAVCRNHNIQIESEYTAIYNSQYIEGINHIYEFDGGSESGWMFRVNGGYPQYGCSSYTLKDGDSIVWAYTVNLGKDLGE